MKNVAVIVAIVGCLSICGYSYASNPVVSNVEKIYIQIGENWAYVRPAAAVTGQPTCATNPKLFAINLTTESGKAAFSLILAARKSATPVQFRGSGACTIKSGYEDLGWVSEEDM